MEDINLYKLCQDFEGIKNDVLWAPCKNGHYNLPKLKTSFGKEFFPLNCLKYPEHSTSTINDIVLHSPYNLKINIKNAMKNKYGTKLDVNKFKTDFNPLFWNFVWYCKVQELDFSILLPYDDRIEQIRTNKVVFNQNLKKIKLIYSNKDYISIENKLKGFSKKDTKGGDLFNYKFQNLKIQKVTNVEIKKQLKTKIKKLFGSLFSSSLKKSVSVPIKK